MLEKPITTIFGLLLLIFIGWVLISATPQIRLERGCRPFVWAGNVTVSVAALMDPPVTQQSAKKKPDAPDLIGDAIRGAVSSERSLSTRVQGGFDSVYYGCVYSLWRLFYEEEYKLWIAKQADEAARRAADQSRRSRPPAAQH